MTNKFPGSTAEYGDGAVAGRGDNSKIPLGEGGDLNPATGREFRAKDFEGEGGPEDKLRKYAEEQGGNDDLRQNVKQ